MQSPAKGPMERLTPIQPQERAAPGSDLIKTLTALEQKVVLWVRENFENPYTVDCEQGCGVTLPEHRWQEIRKEIGAPICILCRTSYTNFIFNRNYAALKNPSISSPSELIASKEESISIEVREAIDALKKRIEAPFSKAEKDEILSSLSAVRDRAPPSFYEEIDGLAGRVFVKPPSDAPVSLYSLQAPTQAPAPSHVDLPVASFEPSSVEVLSPATTGKLMDIVVNNDEEEEKALQRELLLLDDEGRLELLKERKRKRNEEYQKDEKVNTRFASEHEGEFTAITNPIASSAQIETSEPPRSAAPISNSAPSHPPAAKRPRLSQETSVETNIAPTPPPHPFAAKGPRMYSQTQAPVPARTRVRPSTGGMCLPRAIARSQKPREEVSLRESSIDIKDIVASLPNVLLVESTVITIFGDSKNINSSTLKSRLIALLKTHSFPSEIMIFLADMIEKSVTGLKFKKNMVTREQTIECVKKINKEYREWKERQ